MIFAITLFCAIPGCRPEASDVSDAADLPVRVSGATETEVLSIELPGEPAETYVAASGDGSSSPLARRIHGRFPALELSECLRRAAVAHLAVPESVADSMPLSFTEFALHWAGCPDPSATVGVLKSSETGDDVLIDWTGEPTTNGQPVRSAPEESTEWTLRSLAPK